jgi:hypothetical protein
MSFAPAWQPIITGDQTRSAFIGKVGPSPLDHDQEPVAEADQKKDMNEQP